MLGSGNKTVGKTNKSSCPHGDDVPAGRERNKFKKKEYLIHLMVIGSIKKKNKAK